MNARALYTLLLSLLLPLVVARLAWRGLRAPGYRRRLGERFGLIPPLPLIARPLWLHSVSVGETQAAAPLVREFMVRHPQVPVVITTTTPTGAERARQLFGEGVTHLYTPYDLPWVVRRFLTRVRPRLLLVMETELWPNTFHLCRRAGIPVMVANARLSERSAAGYARFPRLVRDMLGEVHLIAAHAEEDAQRFRALGAPAERVAVTGNIKFDIHMPASLREQGEALRRQLGVHRPVWVAASTHEGEEALVLAAHRMLQERMPDALLVLVPRHPERFARVAALCRGEGFATAVRSEGEACAEEVGVYLGDTMGELPLFFAAADLAFVGGSLVPTGGHNALEPAALGVPVLFGPHTFNFTEISRLLVVAGGAFQVENVTQLARALEGWLADPNLREVAGEKAKQVVRQNRGALERLLARVDEAIGRRE